MAEYNFRRYEWYDILDALDEAETKGGKDTCWGQSSRRERDERWSGTKTWEDAVKLLREGYPQGLEQMAEAVEIAAATVDGKLPSVLMDVAGNYPVPPLAAAGDPLNMVQFTPWEEAHSPIVRIEFEGGMHCGYPAECFTTYGAALMTAINQLEKQRYRVELTALYTNSAGSKMRTIAVRLKDAHEALDLDMLSFTMSHPSMYRRIVFALMEAQDEMRDFRGGYGCPSTIREEHRDPDVTYLIGPQQFSKRQLATPQEALRNLLPFLQERLLDKGCPLPPLQDWCDIHEIGEQAVA